MTRRRTATAFANPLLPRAAACRRDARRRHEAGDRRRTDGQPTNGDRMPGAMEATEGIAPEITTHKRVARSAAATSCRRRSRRSRAWHDGPADDADEDGEDVADEDADAAALAEGRARAAAGDQRTSRGSR